jgi:hypothetical protein
MKKIFTLLFSLIFLHKANAQFTANVTPVVSATQLVQGFAGNGVLISNATLSCANGAAGVFNGTASSIAMDSGIVLTTGTVLTSGIINGVNAVASSNAAKDNGITGGDADLAATAGQTITNIKDLCKLEFDFVPLSDTVKFKYRFASEEYPEFNCTPSSDIFAFYITSGPGYTVPTNIALIPGTNIAVSVNSINSGVINNVFGGILSNCTTLGAGSPFTTLYVDNSASSTIVYDGMTQNNTSQGISYPM